jgi:hypothetical protein
MHRRFAAALLAVVCTACGNDESQPTAPNATAATAAPTASAAAATASAAEAAPAAWHACAEKIEAEKQQPAVAGAKTYEEQRVHFARVRGQAMLWRREPAAAHPDVIEARKKNDSYDDLVQAIRRLIRKTKPREARRAMLLREGYLWEDDVELALALVEQISLTDLYAKESLFIQRGVNVFELKFAARTRLDKDRYVYVGGPFDGERAEILLGDRVAETRDELDKVAPLGVDLGDLMDRHPFDRLRPLHFSERALVAELRYGPDTWVPALLSIDGAKLEIECEALDNALAEKKEAFVTATATHRAAMKRVRGVVRAMVREELPFDADRDQTNGFLRRAWKRAYFKGWRKFNYEGKLREVYTEKGQPRPPQVCIDFLTDAWERASGTWYRPAAGDPLAPSPERTEGAIDFDKLKVGNRRSVAKFTEFTEENSDWFDVWKVPKDKRIAFNDRGPFFDYLREQADMLRPGDMLTIHGYKEGGRPHYHSIIVLEQDPITGVPTLIAGNAVFAREQTLEGVMHISPKRSLRHRIRVKDKWLEPIKELADKSAPI